MNTLSCPSLALQAANARLLSLRPQRETENRTLPAVALPTEAAVMVAKMPAHLGWGSDAVTANLRRRENVGEGAKQTKDSTQQPTKNDSQPANRHEQPKIQNLISNIGIYPSLAIAMLREGQVGAGRLWWLCRHLDTTGQGSLRIVLLKQKLTQKDALLHLCGKRRLRQLLAEGDGIFWTRDKERVWLRSAVKVAELLGVAQFQGKMVEIPAISLCDTIVKVRAHFYASFHAGRGQELNGAGEQGITSSPIARETLKRLTGVGRRSQQVYERETRMTVSHNIAIGKRISDHVEATARTRGTAYFTLKDRKGTLIEAWQLPNSYRAPHKSLGRGRQKYLNQRLNDLRMKRDAGNEQIEEEKRCRRYFKDGKNAGKAYNRNPDRDVYWRHSWSRSGKQVWNGLLGNE